MLRNTKYFWRAAVLLFGTIALGACSGAGTEAGAALTAPLAQSQARLKLYRPSALPGSLADARVKIDGREVASLSNDNSKVMDVAVGHHQVVVDHWGHPNVYKLDLDVKPGMVYALEVTVRDEAVVAGALFGTVGVLAEAAANENGGTFQIRLTGEKPIGS